MIDITVKEISDRLSASAEVVCAMLLPGGKMFKGEWVCGDIAGGPGDSLKVHLSGPHAGQWRDWANDDDHGDLIDLWRAVKGCSAPEAIKLAKDWLGIAQSACSPIEKSYAAAPKRADLKPLDANGKAMEFLTKKRGLTKAIVEQFRIQGDAQENAIVFPCYGPDGALVNRSYRTLDAKKKVWQDTGCAPCMFGWHALSQDAYRTRTVLLCEGQIDAASWTQWGIPALSIPNGSGQTWIANEWDNLAAFDKIYISFDMDGAGRKNAESAIQRLGEHRCLVVTIPLKDANDCLLDGYTTDHAKEWLANAKHRPMKGLVTANDLEQRLRVSMLPQPDCFTLPFLKSGSDGGFYPRPHEVTVWTGVTGHGKSTFLNYFMLSLILKGHPVLIASMETKVETIVRKMMAGFLNREPVDSDISDFLAVVGRHLIFADVVGYIGQTQLIDMMRFSQRRYGVCHVLVDSLMRIEGLEEDYVQQGQFLNRIQEFVKTSGVHVHLVAHPRKLGDDGKPGKMDIKGSSLIPNNADNIVAVCRNVEKDRLRKDGELSAMQQASMYDAEIRVEKQRETGWEGRFLLKFDPASFSYSKIAELEVSAPAPKKPTRNYH